MILLSKKDTSLGLFPYFLILLSFFGLKLVLNILLWLQNYEIWSFFTILGPKNSILQTKNTKRVKYCLLTLWEMLNRNECIPVRYEFIPERNEFIPNRNEIIPDRYWNWGSWIVSKNKTFYVGKGSGSIIFNFQAAAAVERKKGELCLLKVLCGMNSFQSGMNSF